MPKSNSIKLNSSSVKKKNANKLNSILNRTLSDSILDKKSHGFAAYFHSPYQQPTSSNNKVTHNLYSIILKQLFIKINKKRRDKYKANLNKNYYNNNFKRKAIYLYNGI